MDPIPIASYPVSDFLQWRGSDQLEIAPRFQRRSIWSPQARSYLIDTVIRGMPIPPVFIRMTMNLSERRAIREVVDGQQRIRAILEFIRGDFEVLKVHNDQYGSSKFDDLPSEVQKAILSYKLPVFTLENIGDADVLKIFARLNTYTFPLNKQELRNAEFFGAFKQTVYGIAYQHYGFWRTNRILTDQAIARMADAELVSELLVTMVDGFQSTRDRDLRKYYENFDDQFKQGPQLAERFERVLEAIGFVFGDEIRNTRFRSVPMFFSLACLFYDALFGLPESDHSRLKVRTKTQATGAFSAFKALSDVARSKKPPKAMQDFVNASNRATADLGRRRTRHKYLWQALAGAFE